MTDADDSTDRHESSLPGFLGVIDTTISRIESFFLARDRKSVV